jgi:hypothetical protein
MKDVAFPAFDSRTFAVPSSHSISGLEAKTNPLGATIACGKWLSGPESPHPYNFLTGNNDGPMFSTPEKYLMFLE